MDEAAAVDFEFSAEGADVDLDQVAVVPVEAPDE
jgi:hypothetical protein